MDAYSLNAKARYTANATVRSQVPGPGSDDFSYSNMVGRSVWDKARK